MEPDFAINDLVEVKAIGMRLGHRGWLVNQFACGRLLYAVQFPDNWIGYFERSELERVPAEETATDWERSRVFKMQPIWKATTALKIWIKLTNKDTVPSTISLRSKQSPRKARKGVRCSFN